MYGGNGGVEGARVKRGGNSRFYGGGGGARPKNDTEFATIKGRSVPNVTVQDLQTLIFKNKLILNFMKQYGVENIICMHHYTNTVVEKLLRNLCNRKFNYGTYNTSCLDSY